MTSATRAFRTAGLCCLLAVLVPAAAAWATGFIVVDRPVAMPDIAQRPIRPMPPRAVYMPLELRRNLVTTDIRETVATTRVEQVFHNVSSTQLEGYYMLPLPAGASVQKFSMWINDKETQGELLDAAKARQTYEEIVRRTRDPALLEYVGAQLLRARVFPIPANGDVRVAVSYGETVPVSDGLAAWRYRLGGDQPVTREIDEVAITVNIKSEIPLKSVFCPSYTVTVGRPDEHNARVGYEARNVVPDRDFVVYYQSSRKDFGLTLLGYRPEGEDGFFMARIAPPAHVDTERILPKDVCFVLDTSGSMSGEKIEQARRALRFCVSALREPDRFNLITFATEVRPFRDALVPASPDNTKAARAAIDSINAAGGTNINEALLAAIKARPQGDPDRPYMIVFVTDGHPTVDVTDEEQILRNIHDAAAGKMRLFVFGVGHNLNARLLDRLAEDNRGAREYIDEKEDIELKVSGFFRKVASPVLSGINLTVTGAELLQTYPKALPDLFEGSEIVLVGRYRNPGRHTIVISGQRGKEQATWEYEATFPSEQTTNDFIPHLWAARKIGYLMDEIRLHGENSELKDEIVQLAKRYGIVTPYTAYLVIEDSRPGVADRTPVRPMAPMARRLMESANKDGADADALEALGRSYAAAGEGRAGVRASREALDLQTAPSFNVAGSANGLADLGYLAGGKGVSGAPAMQPASTPEQRGIQTVGDKTFVFVDGRWTDTAYDAKAETRKIKAFSDEYFKLLDGTPDLGRCLAIGSRVVVVLGGTPYEIAE